MQDHCREGKTALGFPFFGAFPSDRIPKATKGVNVQLFIHSSNSYKLYHHIPRIFENTTFIYQLPLMDGTYFTIICGFHCQSRHQWLTKITHLDIKSIISYSIIKVLSNLNETVVIRVLKSTALFKTKIPLKLSCR